MKKLTHNYDKSFVPTEDYLNSLPDLAHGDIKGAATKIEKVGISNFHLPLLIKTQDGDVQEVEAQIVGTVSLEGLNKGINMSRIIRTFYEYRHEVFSMGLLNRILESYTEKLGSYEAHIMMSFRYRMWQESLRSVDSVGNKNGGWQYYNVTFECSYNSLLEKHEFNNIIHFDFVYSSACPCSTELSLHAMETRGQYAIPHSQRSIMRASILCNEMIWIEDIHQMMLKALQTETQVFVKREDEQAFAELNAANTKFVEDAVRLVYEEFEKEPKIADFKLIASHNESLHSHDAIAVITANRGHFENKVSIHDLKSLVY